jgi:phage gp36-like protein
MSNADLLEHAKGYDEDYEWKRKTIDFIDTYGLKYTDPIKTLRDVLIDHCEIVERLVLEDSEK